MRSFNFPYKPLYFCNLKVEYLEIGKIFFNSVKSIWFVAIRILMSQACKNTPGPTYLCKLNNSTISLLKSKCPQNLVLCFYKRVQWKTWISELFCATIALVTHLFIYNKMLCLYISKFRVLPKLLYFKKIYL